MDCCNSVKDTQKSNLRGLLKKYEDNIAVGFEVFFLKPNLTHGKI